MNILKLLFPALMVVGAVGSFIVELLSTKSFAVALQWIGASLLYTALLMRNLKM